MAALRFVYVIEDAINVVTKKRYHNFTWAIKGFLRDENPCKTQQFVT